MTTDLNRRLLRIQMLLEAHDEHTPDCSCHFCQAIDQLSLLRGDLRRDEIANLRMAGALESRPA